MLRCVSSRCVVAVVVRLVWFRCRCWFRFVSVRVAVVVVVVVVVVIVLFVPLVLVSFRADSIRFVSLLLSVSVCRCCWSRLVSYHFDSLLLFVSFR